MSNYFMNKVGPNSWPFGRDGKLHIVNAQTVQLNPGDIKDYSSIQIDAGGKLEILAGSDWTILGCRASCIINGTVELLKGEHVGAASPYLKTAPDGASLSYPINQQNGGDGGDIDQPGGSHAFGNGGGGGGAGAAAAGEDALTGRGGRGGSSVQYTGGAGAAIYSGTGGNGDNTNDGGGGGSRGRHGQALYLKIRGNYSGSGTIDVYGGDGGDGGDSYTPNSPVGTSGGGGAAGGSGGKIQIRYKGTNTFAGSYDVTGGAGGAGGAGSGGGGAAGDPGVAGTNGQDGSTDVASY